MQAIIKAGLPVSLVIAPVESAPGLAVAKELGVRTDILDPHMGGYAEKLVAMLEYSKIDILCLAGFMSLLPASVLGEFSGAILNIHPALLPKFGGQGMFGHHVHEAVVAAKEAESGCTVHHVNEVYDQGGIILQKKCPVLPEDTPTTLAARVLELEHQAYPEAIQMVAQAMHV